jgi:flagellar motility protein MotE (MotC chaperone)
MGRFRLLPVTIFVAVMMLSVKVGDAWRGVQMILGSVSMRGGQAQAQQQPAAGQPPAAQGAAGQSQGAAKPPATPPAAAKPEPKLMPKPAGAEQTAARTAGKDQPLDPILFSQSEIELLQQLSSRRKEIDRREEEIKQREGLLVAAEKRLEGKLDELKTLRSEIDALIKKYDEQEEQKMRSLVKIYETMKPKEAATIFNDLEFRTLIDVLQRMKEAKTAPILATMDAKRARDITIELAQRKEIPKISQ